MATEEIKTTYTGISIGIDWAMWNSSNFFNSMNVDNDAIGIQHRCNRGSDYTTARTFGNTVATDVGVFTACDVATRTARSGTTNAATQRVEIHDGTSWWVGAFYNSVNTFRWETVTNITSQAEMDAAQHRWLHDQGDNTSSSQLRQDYLRLRMTYLPSGGNAVVLYGLPFALPFLSDALSFVNGLMARQGKAIVYDETDVRLMRERTVSPVTFDFGGIPCLA